MDKTNTKYFLYNGTELKSGFDLSQAKLRDTHEDNKAGAKKLSSANYPVIGLFMLDMEKSKPRLYASYTYEDDKAIYHELNSDGSERKHGRTVNVNFRLDEGTLSHVKEICEATGVPQSEYLRDCVSFATRDNMSDGSFILKYKRKIHNQSSTISASNLDDILSFGKDLSQMRTDLNRLGNNLKQDIAMRYRRRNELEAEEKNSSGREAEFENERQMIINKYDSMKKKSLSAYKEDMDIAQRTIRDLKIKGLDSSDRQSKLNKLISEYNVKVKQYDVQCEAEIESVRQKYLAKDFTREKTQLVMMNEQDENLRTQIDEAVKNISQVIEEIGHVIRTTVPNKTGQ